MHRRRGDKQPDLAPLRWRRRGYILWSLVVVYGVGFMIPLFFWEEVLGAGSVFAYLLAGVSCMGVLSLRTALERCNRIDAQLKKLDEDAFVRKLNESWFECVERSGPYRKSRATDERPRPE